MQLALVIANVDFFAVGGDGDAEELVEEFDGLDDVAASNIPNTCRFVGRGRDDLASVWGESYALDGATMANEGFYLLSIEGVPNFDGFIGRGGDKDAAIAVEGEVVDAVFMPGKDSGSSFAFDGPALNCVVPST